MSTKKKSILVLYNHPDEDEFERLREVDPSTLAFTPEYNIHVPTAAEEYEAIARSLRAEGFNARTENLHEDFDRLVRALAPDPPDAIFNLVEYFHDDLEMEASVAGLFDLHRVPFTGASGFTLALCRRKGLTKQILLQDGIPTPRFLLLWSAHIDRRHRLRYPLIVKPARQDASSGVTPGSVVHDRAALVGQVEKVLAEFQPPVLVEEFLEGEELHVSILGNDPPEVLPIVQFDFSGLAADHPPIITYDVKWNPLSLAYHRVHSFCPARLPKRLERRVKDFALRAYRLTGCRDYARIDMRLTRDGQPHVLEVNPNPDLTEGVSFMESSEKAGMSFSETLRRVVEFALARGARRGQLAPRVGDMS